MKKQLTQSERPLKLNEIAIIQMSSLLGNPSIEKLKDKNADILKQ